MPSPRSLWRALRIIEHLLTGTIIALGLAAGQGFGLRFRRLPQIARWWHARLCRILDLQMEVTGEIASNALLVVNHISWLDVSVLGSQAEMDFLAKAEVRNWPLIGRLAKIAGTLFIARGGNQTGVLIPEIAALVRRGGHVVIFPEGTTTDGSRLQHFHPRLFGAGQLEGVLVQPIALRYGTNAVPDPVAPFIGDDALLPHLARLLRHDNLRVHLRFLPPLDGRALSRRQIAEHCRRTIAESLGLETSDTCSLTAEGDPAPASFPGSTALNEAA